MLTVHGLQLVDDLAQGHFAVLSDVVKTWKHLLDGNLLLQILFSPAVVVQLQLGRSSSIEIGVGDVKRVKVGNVMASDLVSTDEELNLTSACTGNKGQSVHLQVVGDLSAAFEIHLRATIGGRWNSASSEAWSWTESRSRWDTLVKT